MPRVDRTSKASAVPLNESPVDERGNMRIRMVKQNFAPEIGRAREGDIVSLPLEMGVRWVQLGLAQRVPVDTEEDLYYQPTSVSRDLPVDYEGDPRKGTRRTRLRPTGTNDPQVMGRAMPDYDMHPGEDEEEYRDRLDRERDLMPQPLSPAARANMAKDREAQRAEWDAMDEEDNPEGQHKAQQAEAQKRAKQAEADRRAEAKRAEAEAAKSPGANPEHVLKTP